MNVSVHTAVTTAAAIAAVAATFHSVLHLKKKKNEYVYIYPLFGRLVVGTYAVRALSFTASLSVEIACGWLIR